jgi:hypothetical protein
MVQFRRDQDGWVGRTGRLVASITQDGPAFRLVVKAAAQTVDLTVRDLGAAFRRADELVDQYVETGRLDPRGHDSTRGSHDC